MFDDKKTAGERLILAAKELPDTEPVVLGEYRGFELSARYEPVRNEQQAVLKGKAIYPVALGADPHGNITRLDNLLAGFDERIANAENRESAAAADGSAGRSGKALSAGRRTGTKICTAG